MSAYACEEVFFCRFCLIPYCFLFPVCRMMRVTFRKMDALHHLAFQPHLLSSKAPSASLRTCPGWICPRTHLACQFCLSRRVPRAVWGGHSHRSLRGGLRWAFDLRFTLLHPEKPLFGILEINPGSNRKWTCLHQHQRTMDDDWR